MSNIYKKLISVQNELKAPKSQYNAFGKYKYRNCEDILEALKPLLLKYNLALYLTDDVVQIGERFYVKATATLIDTEEDNCSTFVTALAREEDSKKGMDGSQVTGASSSYARKYALNGLFAIDDTKDSDATNNGNDEAQIDWRKEFIRVCKEKGIDSVAYAQDNGINKKTTQEEYKRIVNALRQIQAVSMDEI